MSAINGIDTVVHQRTRLAIMAALVELSTSSFTNLRDTLELTDGNLSRHLTVLEEAGYVQQTKEFVGRTPRTHVSVTPAGQAAFTNHVAALESMITTARAAAGNTRDATTIGRRSQTKRGK